MEEGHARRYMLEPVALWFIEGLQIQRRKLFLEITEGHDFSGVVGCHRGALELLSQNLVAGPDALGVECGREELASGLA